MLLPVLAVSLLLSARAQDPLDGAIVHLLEWRYDDIAVECDFLSQNGYDAVVISPPTENTRLMRELVLGPWHERYEPVSYELVTRSGDEKGLKKMITACRKRNIKVIVELNLNNMANTKYDVVKGSGGRTAIPKQNQYFNFEPEHFHKPCDIKNYNDPAQVRNCMVANLADLDQSHPVVRKTQIELLQKLLEMGVSGFMFDKAKFMWPYDFAIYVAKLNDVRSVTPPTRPVVIQNVEDHDSAQEAVRWREYNAIGFVTDYKYGFKMNERFKSKQNFQSLKTFDNEFKDWIPSEDALVFLTNIYGLVQEPPRVITYNSNPEEYKLATAFMLAYPRGTPYILSSYQVVQPFDDSGPPAHPDGSLVPPAPPGKECGTIWNCEHRLPEVYKMVNFRKLVKGLEVSQWFEGNGGQTAFTLGNQGFIAFNLGDANWTNTFETKLPAGVYCELLTSTYMCDVTSKVTVDAKGSFQLDIPARSFRVLHISKIIGGYLWSAVSGVQYYGGAVVSKVAGATGIYNTTTGIVDTVYTRVADTGYGYATSAKTKVVDTASSATNTAYGYASSAKTKVVGTASSVANTGYEYASSAKTAVTGATYGIASGAKSRVVGGVGSLASMVGWGKPADPAPQENKDTETPGNTGPLQQ